MSRDYCTPQQPYLYTAQDSGSGGSGGSGLGPGSTGMDCLQPLRCPPTTPGPFHYLINEQAKSLVALQELQNEVGALLEFRDLVIETFPNLRNKMAAAVSSSSPVTMTSTNSNIPIPRRDWEPGIRVRRRIKSPNRSRSNSHSGKKSSETTSVVQDSGFSTETSSSKESTVKVQAEDELWNLLDVIQVKGTKLRDDVEALQGALQNRGETPSSEFLLAPQDVINLRRERDILLEKLAEMESENLAGRVQASRLRADLESLLATKTDLEDQLRAAITQKSELNSRIHDLHLQFVKSAPSSPESPNVRGEKPVRRRRTLSSRVGNSQLCSGANLESKELLVTNFSTESSILSNGTTASSSEVKDVEYVDRLNEILGYVKNEPLPKVRNPDSGKIAAILQEHDSLVLQKSLLTVTVHNQALKQRLDIADKFKGGLVENLKKAREQNEDLKFQLEEKVIELEGTKAHVRVLERFQYQKVIDSDLDTPSTRQQLSTPSMKAMTPLPLDQNNSSTESAHDQKNSTTPSRKKPSRIPLPGAAQNKTKSSSSLPRPGSAQSAGSSLVSGAKSATSVRSSLGRMPSVVPGRSSSVCNKRDGLTRVTRRVNKADTDKIGKIKSDDDVNSDLYSDSLNDEDDENPDSVSEINDMLWNKTPTSNLAKIEYFDSINSEDVMSSGSLQPCGEGLAECCDSLESELQNIQLKNQYI